MTTLEDIKKELSDHKNAIRDGRAYIDAKMSELEAKIAQLQAPAPCPLEEGKPVDIAFVKSRLRGWAPHNYSDDSPKRNPEEYDWQYSGTLRLADEKLIFELVWYSDKETAVKEARRLAAALGTKVD